MFIVQATGYFDIGTAVIGSMFITLSYFKRGDDYSQDMNCGRVTQNRAGKGRRRY
jgi:hypothetical protein